MDSPPLQFCDDVISHLRKRDIYKLKSLSGYWSPTAAANYEKRRELEVFLTVNTDGTEVGISTFCGRIKVPLMLDLVSDRLVRICCGWSNSVHTFVPIEYFRERIIPAFRIMAYECDLYVYPHVHSSSYLNDTLFDGLRDCGGISALTSFYFGQKSCDFIKRQIEIGNLKELDLSNEYRWPVDMQTTVTSFVKSPNFRVLNLRKSNLKLDFEMVSHIFDRAFKEDSKESARLHGKPSFQLAEISQIYADFACLPKEWTQGDVSAYWMSSAHDGQLESYCSSDGHMTFRTRRVKRIGRSSNLRLFLWFLVIGLAAIVPFHVLVLRYQ